MICIGVPRPGRQRRFHRAEIAGSDPARDLAFERTHHRFEHGPEVLCGESFIEFQPGAPLLFNP